MKLIPSLFVFFLATVPAEGFAKTLDDYFDILDTHPRIEAINTQATALRYQAAGTAGLPDPSLFVGVENLPVDDPAFDSYLPSSKIVGFSQSFPGFGSRDAQKNVFLSSADNAELHAEYTREKLKSFFLACLADLERVKKQTAYENKKQTIIAQLQEYYEGRIVSGDTIFQKTYETEMEHYDVEHRINTLSSEKMVIEADLVQLVGEVPVDVYPETGAKGWSGDIGDLYPVRLALGELQIMEARVKLADRSLMPEFGVSATYKFREDGDDDAFEGDDWFSLQVRMSIPLWASQKQLPRVDAAKSRKKSAQMQHRDVVRVWQKEIKRLQSEKETSLLNLATLQKKERALQGQIAALERTYSSGQTSLEPVLLAELAHLTLLSQIADEEHRQIVLTEEINTHILVEDTHE